MSPSAPRDAPPSARRAGGDSLLLPVRVADLPVVAPTSVRPARPPLSAFSAIAVGLLLLLGVCTLLYPSGASWLSALVQRSSVADYENAVDELDPDRVRQAIEDAEAYNLSLAGEVSADPFTDLAAANLVSSDPYWSLLSGGPDGVMSVLRIPDIAVDLPIRHGTSVETLHDGLGHLRGSSLPIGGDGTHAVVTGHNGVPESTLFSRLDELGVGDDIEVSTYGRDLFYRVVRVEVLLPVDVRGLGPEPGRDLLTLITCTPTGVNSHRLVLTAERVAAPVTTDTTARTPVEFPWWMLALAVTLLLEALLAARWLRRRHNGGRRSSGAGS